MTVSICWECDYPNELVFFRGVETTNQLMAFKCIDMVCVYIYMNIIWILEHADKCSGFIWR